MCGFTGFYSLKNSRTRAEMHVVGKRMTQSLVHRGPDSGDIWQDPDCPLLLGHRRLAILDLSPEGHQPMTSPSGRYVIVFNGEIYNHLEIRDALVDSDVIFRGRSDTETLLAAIDHWGLNLTLQKLRGMFAFALWDRKERTLDFVRDRFGKKPLYIGWAGKNLVFGSELKALRQHPDFNASIDKQAMALYLRYSCVPAPHSIYEQIWQIPPGHRLRFVANQMDANINLRVLMHPYWSAKDVVKDAKTHAVEGNEDAIVDGFEELLSRSIKDRMISDVPLGAFLSGGIDSSCVVALMQKISDTPVHSFTIGFEDAAYNEAEYAAKIAAHLGTKHHEHICTSQDARDIIPALPDMYDEPFADQSAIPTYLVSKFAREHVSVALSGDGGDEMLGGYSRHMSGPKIYGLMRPLPSFVRGFLAKSITRVSVDQWQALRKNKPLFGRHMHKAASILSLDAREDIYTRLTSAWEGELPTRQFADSRFGGDALPLLSGLSFAEQIMLWDTLSYLPNDILTKVDRASMAVSLEARAPLLDTRICDYVWRLPMEYKIRHGKGKWLLREVLKRHLPAALFERPKQGFNIPTGEWIKGPLKDWAEDLLDPQAMKTQGLLDATQIRRVWDEHLKGQGNHSEALWGVLMFQAWHQRWMK